jgi:hypothetical protein
MRSTCCLCNPLSLPGKHFSWPLLVCVSVPYPAQLMNVCSRRETKCPNEEQLEKSKPVGYSRKEGACNIKPESRFGGARKGTPCYTEVL